MKIKYLFLLACGIVAMTTSCKVNYATNQVRMMPIVFDTLTRTDYITTGDLKAEASVTYKKGKLVAANANNYKQGDLSVVKSPLVTQKSFLARMFEKMKAIDFLKDPGMDFALFALHEKYPDIDYFMNIRVFRNYTMSGARKSGPETVTITATGVDLKTDK